MNLSMKHLFSPPSVLKKSIVAILCMIMIGLFFVVGCKKDKSATAGDQGNFSNPETSLQGTKWKLVGIVDAETGILKELEPKNCEYCYTLMFETSTFLTGFGQANSLNGPYKIDYTTGDIHIRIGTATFVYNGYFDEELYLESLNKVYYFSVKEDQLLLYFNQRSYLLFNLSEI